MVPSVRYGAVNKAEGGGAGTSGGLRTVYSSAGLHPRRSIGQTIHPPQNLPRAPPPGSRCGARQAAEGIRKAARQETEPELLCDDRVAPGAQDAGAAEASCRSVSAAIVAMVASRR